MKGNRHTHVPYKDRADEVGDAALASAIREGKSRGTTFVVITHRTSVLDVADKLLFLADGTVRIFGPRDDVLAALKKANQEAAAQAQARAQAQAAQQPATTSTAIEAQPAPEVPA